mmetsp:Transcript_75479/g.157428  ORF Transcript_75479/g.157428 Transcript_75479/m.157428 type:complete len:323 (+) Transcript_75479:213-1181(+)|eukprot:CAMPEP_0206432318 /NCGR_PEP_ID=MMETSP0324_2-20121206/7856_1 /ASSEMBLY_ACC=CAM_ASM_000836 /TAXON_ID=2866 /ORGANISM="Crypthecodinium cohnii, Strain Seligo" /LENGTH=322 /DNA_ID=CAMNT_0053898349 /DNA_START=104 /DNA_END=1072 /DNA_ORIENTATION=-
MGNSALRCCVPSRSGTRYEEDGDDRGLACNRVELAASELFAVPGLATAYHTSILVNGEEFFFSDSGIFNDRALTSHQGQPSERVQLGWSTKTGSQLLRALAPHFRAGTYDLLRKNCNSFSDCAAYYLLRKRLQGKYSALERMGMRASPDLLNRFTKGMYVPNQASEGFSIQTVLKAMDELGDADPPGADGIGSGGRSSLSIGARVTVCGLKNAAHLNGQGAQIVRFNAVNGRWEAQVNADGEIKAFRAENLRPAGELIFMPGEKALIRGLKSDAGQTLNGISCEVVQYMHDTSRYQVRLVDGTLKAIKGDNLQPITPEGETR